MSTIYLRGGAVLFPSLQMIVNLLKILVDKCRENRYSNHDKKRAPRPINRREL